MMQEKSTEKQQLIMQFDKAEAGDILQFPVCDLNLGNGVGIQIVEPTDLVVKSVHPRVKLIRLESMLNGIEILLPKKAFDDAHAVYGGNLRDFVDGDDYLGTGGSEQ